MTVIKINKNSKGEGFKDFVDWLQEDLNSVNKLVLDNLTNSFFTYIRFIKSYY